MREGWSEETFGGFGVVDSAHDEKTSESGGEWAISQAEPGVCSQLRGEEFDLVCVSGFGNPFHHSLWRETMILLAEKVRSAVSGGTKLPSFARPDSRGR